MRSALACAFGLPALAALLLSPSAALAQDEEPPPRERPTAPDTRTGKPTLALQLGAGTLFGGAESGVSQGSKASWGLVPGLQLALPFTREWAIEAWGSMGTFNGGTSDCPTCKATSITAGLGAVYHLVDGIAVDPWFSFGAGFRRTHLTAPEFAAARDYIGLEAFRVAMGSDYYPARFIGFGPYLELSVGRYLSSSPNKLGDGTGHTAMTTGLRVIFSPF
jgi:hypothetical protein